MFYSDPSTPGFLTRNDVIVLIKRALLNQLLPLEYYHFFFVFEWREGCERWFTSTPQSEITFFYTGVGRELGGMVDTSVMAECIQTQINKKKNALKHVLNEQKIRKLTI